MSYYEDLTNYEYLDSRYELDESYSVLNIGWIDGLHKYSVGNIPEQFLPRLWEYIIVPINRTRGLHYDCILDGQNKTFVAKFQKYAIKLGDAEIRVIDEEHKVVYASPNLILHYIIDHRYCPPKCFIDAVMNGPKPDSICYKKILVEKDKSNMDTKVGCIFCGAHKTRLGFCYDIKRDDTKKIEVVEWENNIDISQENLIYNAICRECGGIFDVPLKAISQTM